MNIGCIGNVVNFASLEYHAVFVALTEKPGQIDCSIDAYRCEPISAINRTIQLILRDLAELKLFVSCLRASVEFVAWIHSYIWYNSRVPRAGPRQFRKPLASCRVMIFNPVIHHSFFACFVNLLMPIVGLIEIKRKGGNN